MLARKARSYRLWFLGVLRPLPVKPLSHTLLTSSRETPRIYSMNSPSSSPFGFPLTTGSTTRYEWKICVEYFPALEPVSSLFISVCQEPLWRWASSSSSQAAAYRVPKRNGSEEDKSRPGDFWDGLNRERICVLGYARPPLLFFLYCKLSKRNQKIWLRSFWFYYRIFKIRKNNVHPCVHV